MVLKHSTCMEYIVHGSKNQIDNNFFNLLWSEFVKTNERRFDLLLQDQDL